jgi:hypothetical protein
MNGKNKLKPQKGFVNYGSESGYPEAVLASVEVVEVEQPKKTRKKKSDVQTEDKEGE